MMLINPRGSYHIDWCQTERG